MKRWRNRQPIPHPQKISDVESDRRPFQFRPTWAKQGANMLRAMILVAGVTALCNSAAAQDKPTWESVADCQKRLKSPVKCFATHARAGFAICSMTWKLALLQGGTDDAAACIRGATDAMPPHYQAAMKRLVKNKTGAAMLKDSYALWAAAMNGLIPSGTKLDYERRTISKEAELDQILKRLELEE
jgi:hypothetical protein